MIADGISSYACIGTANNRPKADPASASPHADTSAILAALRIAAVLVRGRRPVGRLGLTVSTFAINYKNKLPY